MRILVIEDEDSIREILVELCQSFSREVFEAKNGVEGLALLKGKTFDLLVSDYQMPKMSGLDLLRVCRAESIRIPTIWLSGRDNPELKDYAWQFGLFDYLEKPFEVDEFRKSVQMVVDLREELKKEFFQDYQSPCLTIPYEVMSKIISKPTLRGFFEHCDAQRISPSEMIKKILETV